ncbi:UNVERIFIED_CONTAM: hypothetical protein Slati_0966900 [Sesamum latifolium]|uniref:Secreted protein n=1 Tax=Sesamum latifolium TaxID=2727402 RepID=A0AAW2XQL2_9LAMI
MKAAPTSLVPLPAFLQFTLAAQAIRKLRARSYYHQRYPPPTIFSSSCTLSAVANILHINASLNDMIKRLSVL